MKKKLRVYQEDVKTRHTAHWDWDYLTWEEIEHRLKEAGVQENKQTPLNAKSLQKRRITILIWVALGLLIAATLALTVILG